MSKSSIPLATYNLIASQAANREPLSNHREPIIANDDAIVEAMPACPVAVELPDPMGDLLTARRQQRNDTEPHAARGTRYAEPCPIEIEIGLRADVEMMRIAAIGLKKAPYAQRWTVLHDMARQSGYQGFTFAAMEQRLHELGVSGCTTYNRRIIRAGIGTWWEYDPRTDKIYPTGYTEMSRRILELAATITDKHGHRLCDLFLTNAPGDKRDMYIDVAGTATDFESAVLNAWYASKSNPIISRAVLRLLFNRDDRSLRHLEHRAGVQILHNEVETYDPFDVPLKADGEYRSDVYRTKDAQGRTIWHFRLPNTYISKSCRQHPYRGMSRKTSVQFRNWLTPSELSGTCEQRDFPGELKQLGRTYCETQDNAKRSHQRGNVNTIYVPIAEPERGRVRYGAIKSQCMKQNCF